MYDVAIIGAGPAGATLARLTGADHRTLLVDRRHFGSCAQTGPATKCCGGLLAPDAQQMLGALGMGLPRHVLVEPQVFVVRAIDVRQRLERYYQRHYINIDREMFDRWLVSLIPPTVDLRTGYRFVGCQADNAGFRIALDRNGRRQVESARVVIGADGARSLVRKLASSGRPVPRTYAALQEWFEAGKPLPYFSAIFDPEVTDYYSWTIPKDGCLIVGAALRCAPGCRGRFELLKEKIAGLGFRLGRSVRKEAALLVRPAMPSQVDTGNGRIGLIGEAAGWISPSSAEGLSYALRSAMIMAGALRDGLGGFLGRYRRGTRALRVNVLLKNAKSCVICNPFLRGMVMRSGLGAMKLP